MNMFVDFYTTSVGLFAIVFLVSFLPVARRARKTWHGGDGGGEMGHV